MRKKRKNKPAFGKIVPLFSPFVTHRLLIKKALIFRAFLLLYLLVFFKLKWVKNHFITKIGCNKWDEVYNYG